MFQNVILTPFGKAILVVVIVLIVIGAFFLISGFLPLASKKSRTTIKKYDALGKQKRKATVNALDDGMLQLSKKFVPMIKLDKIQKSEREKALRIAGLAFTPEEYTAYILTVSGVFVLIGILCGIFGLITKITVVTIIAVFMIFMGFVAYIYNNRKLTSTQKEALRSIESELPRFVNFIRMNMDQGNETLLSMLERYTATSERFGEELSTTVADAKTSTFNGAISRWDQRINSDKLKQVTHGLISANNGDDVTMYFAMLERDMAAYEVSFLRSNVDTIPRRMRLPKILMYIAVAIAMFYPLIMQIIESFMVVFVEK